MIGASALAVKKKHFDGARCGGARQREKDGDENNKEKMPHDRFSKPRLNGFNAGCAEAFEASAHGSLRVLRFTKDEG